MRRRTHVAILSIACALHACANDTARDPFTARDSAGVYIVTTDTSTWGEAAWRLTADPLLTIGAEEGDTLYLLSRTAGAIRLDDGTVVVADGGSNQVRFYDANGRFLRAVGREGKGPGEFEYIRNLKRCGTNFIYAFDLHWQAKIYDLQGELLREMPLLDPASGTTPYALACSRSGRFVITGWGARTATPVIGFYRATAPVSVLDENGSLLASLGEFPSSERIGTARGSGPHPLGRSTSVEIGADAVYVGTADALEVRKYSLGPRGAANDVGAAATAQLIGIMRGPPQDLTIRPADLDGYRAAQLAEVSADQRPEVERQLRDMPLPPSFPAYTELKFDADGNLWVRRFQRPGEETPRWTIFGPDGVMQGDVITPPGLTVTEIGTDYVIGVHRDDLGVERVQVYGLVKPTHLN